MRFPLRHDNHAILLKATTRIASDGLSHRKPSITAVLRSQPFFSSLAAKRPKPRPRRASVCKTSIPSRGKKTKTTVKLKELPQGLIPLEPQLTENENEESSPYSTVITQVRSNMRKFANCVVLTRVGGFYELYFEHAEEFGPLLNLKVAERRTKRNTAAPVSMAGFPFFQLDRYLKILVQDLNRYVAIAEEFPNDVSAKIKAGGLMHDRKVSRIITPGTLIDENFMDPLTNNYVLAIFSGDLEEKQQPDSQSAIDLGQDQSSPIHHHGSTSVGLAWLDLSTGHFYTQATTLTDLPSFLARICPREIVLDEDLQTSKDNGISAVLAEDRHLITYTNSPAIKPISKWSSMLESSISPSAAAEFGPEEVAAGSLLLHYVSNRLQGSNMKLQPPRRQLDVMRIDKNTMKALEIKKTMKDDLLTGSLLHTVRRTTTRSGSRLLDTWLSSPSTSLSVINFRLDLVEYMLAKEPLRERIIALLRRSHDCHRLLQKFAFGRGDADDLLALASTIYATQDLLASLASSGSNPDCITKMTGRIQIEGPISLAERIREAIDEEGIVQQQHIEEGEEAEMQALTQDIIGSEGSKEDMSVLSKTMRKKKPTSLREHYYSGDNDAWTMKSLASPILMRLHQDLTKLMEEKEQLSKDLCTRIGATSLTLRFSPGLGHICHVKGKDTKLVLTEGRSVSSSKSTRSFHHPDWTHLGQKIDHCKASIRIEEMRVLQSLREDVIFNVVKLRRNAVVLDEIDIACSFATLAAEQRWIRPILNTSSAHKIVGGRHPTVEGGLQQEGRSFTTNDCFVGDVQPLWLITGPNMAGKSTYLRQNALITILAQVGCYVPAEYAEFGIVDQLFSRVGSADNLYRDQSTFMVEMLETAAILKHATPRSFVIMDEIGRGTTPEDGTAVAFACLYHLFHVNKCRTLFATHFHALADMATEREMNGVGFYCTDVQEDKEGDRFRYVHQLRKGVNRQSHALKVAGLAGLPRAAINIAKEVLSNKDV